MDEFVTTADALAHAVKALWPFSKLGALYRPAVIEYRDDGVWLSSGFHVRFGRVRLSRDVVAAESLALDFKRLRQVVRHLPEGRVRCSSREGVWESQSRTVAVLHTPEGALVVPSHDHALVEYPPSKWARPTAAVDAGLADLGSAMLGAMPAASIDESRPNLLGVHVLDRDDRTEVFATDGHRLHLARLDLLDLPTFMLPTALVEPLAHALLEPGAAAWVQGTDLFVSTPDAQFLVALPPDSCPDYQMILPKPSSPRRVDARLCRRLDVLESNLDRGSKSLSWREIEVSTTVTLDGTALLVESGGGWVAAPVDGAPLSLLLNWVYLRDGVRFVNQDAGFVLDSSGDGFSPMSVTSPDGTRVAVIMPMRTIAPRTRAEPGDVIELVSAP